MQLHRLIACLENSDVTELDWCEADFHLRLSMRARRSRVAAPMPTPTPGHAGVAGRPADHAARAVPTAVRALSPGIFLLDHPDAGAEAHTRYTPDVGARLRAGDLVGLVCAGPLYLPVVAPGDGTLTRRVAVPGTVVGYGQALFEMDADALPPRAAAPSTAM